MWRGESALVQFCFAQAECFVIPPEALGPGGLEPEFAALLEQRRTLPPGWVELFSQAFQMYWQRAEELHRRLPGEWLPPRALHCCVVTEEAGSRPYFQPIRNASWLFYRSDFDPRTSDPEFAAYLFVHLERMGWTREVLAAFAQNLGYFLLRSPSERNRFIAAAERCMRPDRVAFRALARAVRWIGEEGAHPELRPRAIVLPVAEWSIAKSGPTLPVTRRREWEEVVREWERTASSVFDRYLRRYRKRARGATSNLLDWLDEVRPWVVLCAEREVLWHPRAGRPSSASRKALGDLHPEVAESLRRDWEVIDRRSRAVLARVSLAVDGKLECSGIEPGGLCWLHAEHGCIAYDLREPGMLRLHLPAPPFERWMLAARAVHEWGHYLAEQGVVGVPPDRRAHFQRLVQELADLCEEVVRAAPSAVRDGLADEIQALMRQHGSVGAGLAQVALARLPDYRANVLARNFLSDEEMQMYVRSNVTCLRQSMRPRALFQRLVRYAYEYQYLRLLRDLRDPWDYFVSVTAFPREFWDTGIVSQERTHALFVHISEICDLQQIDRTRISLEQ